MTRLINDSTGAAVDVDAEKLREDELFAAFDAAVTERLPIHGGTVFHAAINLLRKVIETFDDPNQMAKIAAEALVKQVAINTAREHQ
jgi:hypothetical protein